MSPVTPLSLHKLGFELQRIKQELGIAQTKNLFKPFEIDRSRLGDHIKQPVWFDQPDGWQVAHPTEDTPYLSILEQTIEKIGAFPKVTAKFYWQKSGTSLPMHQDRPEIGASINILLSDNASPISFKDLGDFNYHAALIDISIPHQVLAHSDDRYLLKLSLKRTTYASARKALREYILDDV